MPRVSKDPPPGSTMGCSTDDVWQSTLRSQLCADIDGVFLRRHEQLRQHLDSWMSSQEKKVDHLLEQLESASQSWLSSSQSHWKFKGKDNGPTFPENIALARANSTGSEASVAGSENSLRYATESHTSQSSLGHSHLDELFKSKSHLDSKKKGKAEVVASRRSLEVTNSAEPLEDTPHKEIRWHLPFLTELRRLFKKIVRHRFFDIAFAAVILLNAVFLGVQVEYKSATLEEDTPLPLSIISFCFLVLFFIELVLRIGAEGKMFILSKDWNWNMFDFGVVTLSVAEVVMQVMEESSGDGSGGESLRTVSLVRILRAVRILRVLRVLKLFKFFRSLRVMVHAIFHTLKSCIWALVLLAMLLYMFGIYLTQATTDHFINELSSGQGDLAYYYGSLGRTIFTLFKSTCGGLSWQDAVDPLATVSWFCVLLFVTYISFVYFAVLNVVTGIFCQSALESSNWDTDEVIAEHMHEKDRYVQRLHEVFNDISNNAGHRELTLDAFQAHLHEPRAAALFKMLEIEISDAWTIFNLLDSDGGGIVDVNEFVDGCVQMKGSAKSIHIHQMMHENKWIMRRLHYMTKMLEASLKPEQTKAVRRTCSAELVELREERDSLRKSKRRTSKAARFAI